MVQMRAATVLVRATLPNRHRQSLERAMNWLRSGGWSLQTRWVEFDEAIAEWVAELLDLGERCFISAGDDGFHHRVLNGLLDHARREQIETETVQMGLLPLGSPQDALRNLKQGQIDEAVQALLGRQTRTAAVLAVRHDAGMVYALNHVELSAPVAWWQQGERGTALSLALPHQRVDPRPVRQLIASNGRYWRDQPLFNREMDDGDMALWRWFPRGRGEALWQLGRAALGQVTAHHRWEGGVVARQAADAPQRLAIDGVPLALAWREIAVQPGAIQIFSRQAALGPRQSHERCALTSEDLG